MNVNRPAAAAIVALAIFPASASAFRPISLATARHNVADTVSSFYDGRVDVHGCRRDRRAWICRWTLTVHVDAWDTMRASGTGRTFGSGANACTSIDPATGWQLITTGTRSRR